MDIFVNYTCVSAYIHLLYVFQGGIVHKLEDIARELNLSIATVSRALNKGTENLVKRETRERIFELVKRSGFKPNIKARALAQGKLTNLILILSCTEESIFYDQYFMRLIRGIQQKLVNTEYSLVILSVNESFTGDQIYEILLNNETAGLILSPHCSSMRLYPVDILKEYDIPIVNLSEEMHGRNTYNILLDHVNAGYKAAEFLYDKGYRNIVLISDSDHMPHSEMRKEGFFRFFDEAKRAKCSLKEFDFKLSMVSGVPVLEKVLQEVKLPAVVFSLSDEIAIEMINHLPDKGLKCPDDISILGFDGLPIGAYTNPPLRSVAFPIQEVGELAAKTLVNVLKGDKGVPRVRIVQALITEGVSC